MSKVSHFNSTGLKARLPTTHCTTGLRHAKQYHRETAADSFFLNTEEKQTTLLKDSMSSFLAGYRIGITPGQAMFCFFLLTTALAVCVTLLCCHVSGTDPLTTYKYIVTRLKFYYYYYLRRAPSGNKYFWYRSSMEVSCLNNCNWSEKKRSSYKLVYGTCYRRVQIPL